MFGHLSHFKLIASFYFRWTGVMKYIFELKLRNYTGIFNVYGGME